MIYFRKNIEMKSIDDLKMNMNMNIDMKSCYSFIEYLQIDLVRFCFLFDYALC